MEKLNKVIAGLECCADLDRSCDGCPYDGAEYCEVALMKDALRILKMWDVIHKDIWDRTWENARLKKELKALRDKLGAVETERDDLRKDIDTLHRINEDWRDEVARLHKRIDEARAEGARLSGVAAVCEKPGTRYEWIRSMSPMQMVNWIYHMKAVCDCCDRHYICGVPDDEVTEEYCLEHILLWLGQEAEQ
jgi:regulator of replication initiation timing